MRHFADERKQYGTVRAAVRLVRREGLPLLGYLILALGVGITFEKEHQNVISTRNSLAKTTYDVLYQGCVSGNALRVTLQDILVNPQAIKLDRKLVQEGRISQAELDRAIALARQEAATLAPRNCNTAYAPLKPKR
jgi:hypothetical protein